MIAIKKEGMAANEKRRPKTLETSPEISAKEKGIKELIYGKRDNVDVLNERHVFDRSAVLGHASQGVSSTLRSQHNHGERAPNAE